MSAVEAAVQRARGELGVTTSTAGGAMREINTAAKEGARETAESAKARDAEILAQVRAVLDVKFDQYGASRLVIQIGSRIEALPLESEASVDHVAHLLFQQDGKVRSPDLIRRELGALRGAARAERRTCHVHLRCAKNAGGYLVDLGDAAGRAVEVTAAGWDIVENRDVLFIRPHGYGELPDPVRPASAKHGLAVLAGGLRTIGIPARSLLAVAVALVDWMRPDTPHPIIELVGVAGSFKSAVAGGLLALIDPSQSGNLPDLGRVEPDQLGALGQASYACILDNKASLAGDAQDLLCKCATGTELIFRKFHSQGDVVRQPVKMPVILTAVRPAITRTDLLSRAIRVNLESRHDYVDAARVRAQLEAARPAMVGAMYELLHAGLARLPEVRGQRKWTHRLVDFAQLGEAIVQAAGGAPGRFVSELERARKSNAREIVSGDRFARAVVAALAEWAGQATAAESLPAWRNWGRGAGPRWAAVQRPDGIVEIGAMAVAILERIGPQRADDRAWPHSPRDVGSFLASAATLLTDAGIKSSTRQVNRDSLVWAFEFEPTALAALSEHGA